MTSRLAQMQARFQQKQIQEKEEKLLRLYENQQQRAFERVGRGSAGSNASLGSSTGGGKVRQMFDERRQKAGIDRSYPLQPLKGSKSTAQNRGESVERIKNSTSRTVAVKTTHQKAVSQIRNGKPIGSKREIVHSIYNNNNGDESFEERRFEDNNFNDRDLLEMMNNHNLSDNLDNEEMPEIGFDEPDEPYFTGKLANLGGKLPSENVARAIEKKSTKPIVSTLGKTFRKESKSENNASHIMLSQHFAEVTKTLNDKELAEVFTKLKPVKKPIVKRTVRPAISPSQGYTSSTTSVHSQPSKTVTSPLSSPVKSSVSQTMQTPNKGSAIKKGTPQPSQSARAPSNTRPSAKQRAKSPVARDDLNECRFCSRRFAADRLALHESICGKTAKKKRKVYDATKHRIEGTELEQYVRRGGKNTSNIKATKQPPKKDWRRTHEEFINAIRAAKQAQQHVAKGGRLADLPPPPPSSNPDYVQCPHCGRKFNEAAAERHIPKCADYIFNKPKGGPAPPKGKAPSGRNFR